MTVLSICQFTSILCSPHLPVVLLLGRFAQHIPFISVLFWRRLLGGRGVSLTGDCNYGTVTLLGNVSSWLIQNKHCAIECLPGFVWVHFSKEEDFPFPREFFAESPKEIVSWSIPGTYTVVLWVCIFFIHTGITHLESTKAEWNSPISFRVLPAPLLATGREALQKWNCQRWGRCLLQREGLKAMVSIDPCMQKQGEGTKINCSA